MINTRERARARTSTICRVSFAYKSADIIVHRPVRWDCRIYVCTNLPAHPCKTRANNRQTHRTHSRREALQQRKRERKEGEQNRRLINKCLLYNVYKFAIAISLIPVRTNLRYLFAGITSYSKVIFALFPPIYHVSMIETIRIKS